MSRRYPYGGGAEARAHWARVDGRRYDFWAAANPEKAREQFLRRSGWSEKLVDSSRTAPVQQVPSSAQAQIRTSRLNNVTQSVSGAVKVGVIAGGAFSVTKNLHQVLTGNKNIKLASKDVAVDVVVAAASSAVIAGAAEGIKAAAKSALPNAAKSFVKGSAPVVIAAGALELAVDAYKGTLTVKTASVTVVRTAGGWAGAEIGAATGAALGSFLAPFTAGLSIPVLVVLGGLAGGIGGSVGSEKLWKYGAS
ncbi:MAG: hypothetical protein V4451_18595 [Pseudomonadota bacterium]